MENFKRLYGSVQTVCNVFRFNPVTEDITPRLFVAQNTRKSLNELASQGCPYDEEVVLVINGGLFENVNDISVIKPHGDCYVNQEQKGQMYVGTGNATCAYYNPNDRRLHMYVTYPGEGKQTYCSFLREGAFEIVEKGAIVDSPRKNSNLYFQRDARTMIGIKQEGSGDPTVVIIVTENGFGKGLTGREAGLLMLEYGCQEAMCLDGGGSTGCTYQSQAVVSTTRKLTDVLLFTTKKKPNLTMKLTDSAARIRDDLPNGTVKATAPNGSSLDLVAIYSWKATDGFRWGWAKYNGTQGYFQYDPAVMHPVGNTRGTYKMVLDGSAARIRSSIMGGILTTVPDGSIITINEFVDGLQADRYYWCRGDYRGIEGYFQYDPAVMYPTND